MIRILTYSAAAAEEIFDRSQSGASREVEQVVEEILAAVASRGDAALYEYCARFDHVQLQQLAVSREEIAAAVAQVGPDYIAMLEEAAENIRAFHRCQLRQDTVITRPDGVVLGQRIIPVASAGLYVPGGTASYPSSVLMDAIPAQLAGVQRIVMTTPAARDGSIAPEILAAAAVAGVTDIFKLGGAQAIAALAYGTESVPAVDKIVGPGNIYVATAKQKVYGRVAIDMIAGPSEILVVADRQAEPCHVAADLLSQAEHDRLAAAVLVCDDMALAEAVAAELERQLALLPRQEIARESIERNGKIIVAEDLATGIEIANRIAPEHLELCVADPFRWLGQVKNAGSVFLGRYTPEALGDYWAGPNHTLPTLGTARFSSPLGVDDFVKRSSFIYYTPQALAAAAPRVQAFAESEGLQAHARSVGIRLEQKEE